MRKAGSRTWRCWAERPQRHRQQPRHILTGNSGASALDGCAGIDTTDYGDKNTSVVVTLNGASNATVKVGGINEDTIRNIESDRRRRCR